MIIDIVVELLNDKRLRSYTNESLLTYCLEQGYKVNLQEVESARNFVKT